MKIYNKTLSALGLLLLSGAVALPHLTHAMQLDLDINTQANIENKYDTDKVDRNNEKTRVEMENFLKKEKEDNKKRQDQYKDDHDNRDKSRFGIFSKWWNSILNKNGDKASKDSLYVKALNLWTNDHDANISWSTNLDASVIFEYSTSSNFENSTVINLGEDTDSLALTDLESNTTYYYKVTIDSDEDTDAALVKTGSFTTEKSDDQSDPEGPSLLWIRSTFVSDESATLVWITSERTSSKVWVDADTNVDASSNATESSDSLEYFHSIKVSDLNPSTTYHFKVASTDKDGHTTISTIHSFTTKVE